MLKRLLTLATHKIYNLPIIVMMPHSRCNCRCVMCDIWKANHEKRELSVEDITVHVESFKKLGVREVVLSGGEALMHSNLWKFCELLKQSQIKITLLSTGLLLEKHAEQVVTYFRDVIVSLDGSEKVHDTIRNIPNAYQKLKAGVLTLKKLDPSYPVNARCVLQRHNYFDLLNIITTAKSLRLNHLSFLAADVSTSAFNRAYQWQPERVNEVALSFSESEQFESLVEESIKKYHKEYEEKFIAESPEKMRKLVQYYKAINGVGNFPRVSCNAPWVSAVLESDGSVMPCFFHKSYGNIFQEDFIKVINSKEAVAFRKSLDVGKDPVCKKCVCSLNLGVRQMN